MLEFVTSKKGSRKLVVQVRVHTKDDEIVYEVATHNHTLTYGQVEVERAQAGMTRRGETEETTRSIVQNELMNVPVSAAHLLSKRTTFARDVRRHRQKTEDDLEFLSRSQHWFADETFRVIFPVVYALLYSRTEEAYQHLVQKIMLLKAGLYPDSIVVDIKLTSIRAFQNTFSAETITGCMFHFSQCVWRKLQADRFSERFRNEPVFALLVKRLLTLAFVPPQDVIDMFHHLLEDPAYRDIDVIYDYMEYNFIGRLRRAIRGPPRFTVQLWSQFSRVIDNLRKRKKSIRFNEALHTMVTEYNNRDPITYLEDIARIFVFYILMLFDYIIY
ncbi:hypothetical protein ACJMK2_034401 [Sinanodonta woodiana]|uniref:MULE transposase domain-containing protein n=1 Tax=Sinanodonta woodiana TaxID=1069815 RepID=A0ABD3WUU4_SINWO